MKRGYSLSFCFAILIYAIIFIILQNTNDIAKVINRKIG